jgi:Ribose 5-phosphate isomerase RpiB
MRIAVINEVSACSRNGDIVAAIRASLPDAEIQNVGMTTPNGQPELTYIHTGHMAGILLNAGVTDLIVGGCGTGQGFLNSAMQFPNVFCGLIVEPVDAWLFSQINNGNCISLSLNKGYGWAGDIGLRYIFEKLFSDPGGQGYPLARAESQAASRAILTAMSARSHRPIARILEDTPDEILEVLAQQESFMSLLTDAEGSDSAREIADILGRHAPVTA